MSDNITDIISKLNEINTNTNNKTMLILQGITVFFILTKPVLLFWIKSKYHVKDNPETIENQQEPQDP